MECSRPRNVYINFKNKPPCSDIAVRDSDWLHVSLMLDLGPKEQSVIISIPSSCLQHPYPRSCPLLKLAPSLTPPLVHPLLSHTPSSQVCLNYDHLLPSLPPSLLPGSLPPHPNRSSSLALPVLDNDVGSPGAAWGEILGPFSTTRGIQRLWD